MDMDDAPEISRAGRTLARQAAVATAKGERGVGGRDRRPSARRKSRQDGLIEFRMKKK
jgi:hypothetical protein